MGGGVSLPGGGGLTLGDGSATEVSLVPGETKAVIVMRGKTPYLLLLTMDEVGTVRTAYRKIPKGDAEFDA